MKRKYDEALSNFAFKFNLRRYNKMTMSQYINGPHFDGYRLADFLPSKDFTHPVDFLVPVSVHSVAVADCLPLAKDVKAIVTRGMSTEVAGGGGAGGGGAGDGAGEISGDEAGDDGDGDGDLPDNMKVGALNFPYAAAIYDSQLVEFGGANFYMFVGPDKSRAYPAHRHGLPNYNLMLVLSGHKHVVAWPDQETHNLYPFPTDITPEENEVAEKPLGYGADAFDADVAKQPDRSKVERSWEGIAGPGDLVFIPCGIPHAVQNHGEMLAVGWFASGFAMAGTGAAAEEATRAEGEVYPSLQCPNRDSSVEYTCTAKSQSLGGLSKVLAASNGMFFTCDTE